MLFESVLVALAPLALGSELHADPLQDDRRAEVRAAYVEFADAGDTAALRELWSDNRDLILVTIDADLEAGLTRWESSPQAPPTDEIDALHGRALVGALAATEATGHPIFADYAASFAGWNDDEKRRFRAGQAVYRRAVREIEAGNFEVVIEAGRETRERAQPLGDWWGTAMGYAAEGRGLQGEGHFEHALAAYGAARLIYHDLGLLWSELENLERMINVLRTLESWRRAHVASNQALVIARQYKNTEKVRALLSARAQIERKLGLEQEAVATEAEMNALEEKDG